MDLCDQSNLSSLIYLILDSRNKETKHKLFKLRDKGEHRHDNQLHEVVGQLEIFIIIICVLVKAMLRSKPAL